MRGTPRDARHYELMTVLSPDVPEEEIQEMTERVSSYVTTAGGSIVDVSRESPWGRRRLSYPIRHGGRDVRDGFYTLYHFQAEPHRIEDIERELKLNDRVMRYLLTQYTPRPIAETEATDGESEATAPGEAESESAEAEPPAGVTAEAEGVTEQQATAESPESAETEAATDGGEDGNAAAEEARPPEEA